MNDRRKTDEWKGKTPDSMPPKRVRLRVFNRYGGECHISGRKIRPGDDWDLDHVIAICNGGENRESNLRPALRVEHRKKTAGDVSQKAKDDRIRAKHIGAVPKKEPSRYKVSPSGKITDRETGEVIREAFKPRGALK